MIAASTPVVCSRADTDSRPSASTWKVTRMRAAPATIGGMPRSSKRASERQSDDQLALALHDVDRHRGLAVLEGGEFLRAGDRDRGVARDDLLGQAAHGLEAERQRDHVEQQPVLARRAVAGEHVGLHRRAERHHLVRIEIVERRRGRRTPPTARWICGMRVAPPTITTPLISAARQPRVAQRLAHRRRASSAPGGCVMLGRTSRVSSVTSTISPDRELARDARLGVASSGAPWPRAP